MTVTELSQVLKTQYGPEIFRQLLGFEPKRGKPFRWLDRSKTPGEFYFIKDGLPFVKMYGGGGYANGKDTVNAVEAYMVATGLEYTQAVLELAQQMGLETTTTNTMQKPIFARPVVPPPVKEEPANWGPYNDVAAHLSASDSPSRYLSAGRGMPLGAHFATVEYRKGAWRAVAFKSAFGKYINLRFFGDDFLNAANDINGKKSKGFGVGQMAGALWARAYRADAPVVFVCEGVFDAIAIWVGGFAGVAVFSTGNRPADPHVGDWAGIFSGKRVVLAFDGDTAGLHAAQHYSSYLGQMASGVSALMDMPERTDPNALYISDREKLNGILGRAAGGRAVGRSKWANGLALAGEVAPQVFAPAVAPQPSGGPEKSNTVVAQATTAFGLQPIGARDELAVHRVLNQFNGRAEATDLLNGVRAYLSGGDPMPVINQMLRDNVIGAHRHKGTIIEYYFINAPSFEILKAGEVPF